MKTVKKKILIITHTTVKKDPRISKHIKYFKDRGWLVSFIDGSVNFSKIDIFLFILNLLFRNFIQAYRLKYRKLKHRIKKGFYPDVILVNDWPTLPLAYAQKKIFSAKLIYDMHEWAQDEHPRGLRQKFSVIPASEKIEKTFISLADAVTTVNESIKEKIKDCYGLKSSVVMNCANFMFLKNDKKKIEVPIKLYYHGLYLKMRRLEILIDAVGSLQNKYVLYIKLIGDIKSIEKYCLNMKNVYFIEPSKMSDLVSSSTEYDIGVSYIFPSNFNNWISLPNKFFEYIMAGLPVFSGPSPEMEKIIKEFDIGFVSKRFSKDSIIEALDNITIEHILKARDNVIKAREKLQAKIEWKNLISIAEDLIK